MLSAFFEELLDLVGDSQNLSKPFRPDLDRSKAGPSSLRKLFTLFDFIAKTHLQHPFGIPQAFQPPPQNIIIFLDILFCICSHRSSLPPLPPQSPPLSACCRYHCHCCCRYSVSAATACCCHQCCHRSCRLPCHHRRCRFCF